MAAGDGGLLRRVAEALDARLGGGVLAPLSGDPLVYGGMVSDVYIRLERRMVSFVYGEMDDCIVLTAESATHWKPYPFLVSEPADGIVDGLMELLALQWSVSMLA